MGKLFQSTPFRIALAALAAGILVLVATVTALLLQANRQLAANALDAAQFEADDLTAHFRSQGLDGVAALVSARSQGPSSRLYLLTDVAGKRLAGNLPVEASTEAASGLFQFSGHADAESRLALGVSVPLAQSGRVVVARDIESQRTLTQRTQWLTFFAATLLSAVGLASAALIASDHARRLDAIAERTRAIMSGDLTQRLPLNGSGDEFDRLSGNVNAMLARIDELVAAMREVSDNIAHDLRTPLTRLRNRAEAALRDASGDIAYKSGLERVIEEADELIKTFNALLLIARLESGAVDDTMQPVDVAAIVEDVAELYQPVAEEVGFVLATDTAVGLTARANRQLLGQAIANLVDNAIKYSSGASTRPGRKVISVSARQSGQTIDIVVADHGPGIAADDRARATKRFVRLEKSRSQPGTGLGLSLVAAVARLHAGSLRFEDNAPGLRVILSLPPVPSSVSASVLSAT